MKYVACPNCGHADYGYGQEDGYVICAECDCGDPTNMVGPHIPPRLATDAALDTLTEAE